MGEIAINPIHNVHKKYRNMNLVNPYMITPIIPTYNTYIGGVASSINTPALLATKLGINVSRITNFSTVGSDIKCRITGSYGIPGSAFQFNQTPCTFYRDTNYLVTGIGAQAFYAMDLVDALLRTYDFRNCLTVGVDAIRRANAEYILLDNATSLGVNSLFGNPNLKATYVPRATTYGTSPSVNDGVFSAIPGNVIYAAPSMATVNSGAPEADLVAAISGGATVRYVSNFTAPSAITDLSVGIIYNTAIQLNFTPPSSTNAIDYYECYANGVLKNRIYSSGKYIIGLAASSNYDVTIKAVDIFYNKSVVSNVINVSTTSTNAIASETNTYETRVLADSGVLIDKAYLNDEYVKLIYTGISTNLLSWHNYKSGIKKDGSEKIEKMYSFVDSNFDVVQTTAANKPTYTASGITFDLTDNLSKTLSPVITNKTFSIVWRLKSTPGNNYPGINLGGWDSFTGHSASGGLLYFGITVANRFALGSGSFLTNTDATYTFTYNSTTKIGKIYRDTTLLGSKTMVDPINWTAFSFDAKNGTFYDAKIFSKDLSLTEITGIL